MGNRVELIVSYSRLIVKSPWHLTHPILAEKVAGGGVFVRYPKVSESEAEIDLKCEVANTTGQPENLILRYGLYEVNGLWGKGKPGRKVAEGHVDLALNAHDKRDAETKFRVSSPRLYKKSKAEGLTDAERKEQKILRQEYMELVRRNLRGQLNNIDIEQKDGTVINLGEKYGAKFEKKGN